MGAPVVHFEVIGKDSAVLHQFYSSLFEWEIDANNPLGYGTVAREGNTNAEGAGIGGGVAGVMPGMEEYPGHVTFYVEVPSVEEALAKAERLGGTRLMGPDEVPGGPVIGSFNDPEGHMIGVVEPATSDGG
jgi:predicted enzyme related to lactoylglutathione lyase